MRRIQLGLLTAALPALAFTLFLVGCSNEKKDTGTKSTGGEVTQTKQAPAGETKVLESKGGVLKGKITLQGSPDLAALTKKLQADIAAKADQKDYCLKGSETETTEQEYRIGDNKQLGNVFVWIVPDTGTFFKVSKDQLEKAKSHPVKIRQPHCAFIPHSAFLFSQYRAEPKGKLQATGQILEITNDAEITHNTNWKGGAKNPGDNVIIEAKKKPREVTNLVPETSPILIKCNIHGWMDAHLRVVDTPYYAISHSDTLDGEDKAAKGDGKFGTYEIKNLPVGKVRVLAWHEKAGWLNKDEGRGEVVEIKEGAPTEKNFEAAAK
jgi:hypothetical protein